MITYHCPKCDTTFRHEEAEAVFCPRCQITLCETVEDIETPEIACSGKHRWKANACGLFLLMLFLLIPMIFGYFWWQVTWDFISPGICLLVILACAPKGISHAIERTMPDAVDYDDWMRSSVYRFLKGVAVFVLLTFGIILLALPFIMMGSPAEVLVWLVILLIPLAPAWISVVRHPGMRKMLLLSILAGIICGIFLNWFVFLRPLRHAMQREQETESNRQEAAP